VAASERQSSRRQPTARKSRGAYYTPPELSRFLSRWAIRSAGDQVLEPSCGEASFLLEAVRRLQQLAGARADISRQLQAVEVHPPAATAAEKLLVQAGVKLRIRRLDFLQLPAKASFDAVLGNPPYVRYQQFTGEARERGRSAAEKQGVALNRLASSWAAFTVHASAFLKPKGRLALVLPAELLTVRYAAPVRKYLLKRFASVRLVLFEELVFPGVLEEVVLLLAEGSGGTDAIEVHQSPNVQSLPAPESISFDRFTPTVNGSGISRPAQGIDLDQKWSGALLPPKVYRDYQDILASDAFDPLQSWGEVSLGIVTGNNRYFTLTDEEVQQHKIPEQDLLKISPPGSRHLRSLQFCSRDWQQALQDGKKCYLLLPGARPAAATRRYIAEGEKNGVHQAYKCRIRDPWWRVPLVPRPDLFLTYMDQNSPRLVANTAAVHHLNSLYGVYLHRGKKRTGKQLLPLASLNTITALGAELVGRSYGGGLLKLEPTEADALPLPSAARLGRLELPLLSYHDEIIQALLHGQREAAMNLVDRVLLHDPGSVTAPTSRRLRSAFCSLQNRRTRRGFGARSG
jgi:adenine-specific DNA methylase